MIIEMRPPRREDAVDILPYLRERDMSFLKGKDMPPHQVIIDEIARSIVAYTVTLDSVPAVVWGARLAAILDNRAYIWMLGTTFISQLKLAFLRHSRKALREAGERFSLMYGAIECDFDASERWLKWLGCNIVSDDGRLKRFTLGENR